jgi:ankyrin repeat protein
MPPTLSTLPAEIIYDLADCLSLPELNALLRTSRLFHQQLNHTLHKRGLAATPPMHRHEEGKSDMCLEKHCYNILHAALWMCPSANIVAWHGAGLDTNSCISFTRWTLLHRAVYKNDLEAVSHLLACGANVNAACQYGMTPLHRAVLRLRIELLDPAPSQAAAIYAPSAVASALLRGGADPNCVDRAGETPLHYVVRLFHHGILFSEDGGKIVKMLVEGGAVVDQPDHNGLTPRGLALRNWPQALYRKVFGELEGSAV